MVNDMNARIVLLVLSVTLPVALTPTAAATSFPFVVGVEMTSPGFTPQPMGVLPPGCTFAVTAPYVGTVTCTPPPGFDCINPGVVAHSGSGGDVTGTAQCSFYYPRATTTAGPGEYAVETKLFGSPLPFPFICTADFSSPVPTVGFVICKEGP